MSRIYLWALALGLTVLGATGCKKDRAELSGDRTSAELRAIKGEVTVSSGGKSRAPFRRDRLTEGDVVKIPAGGLSWMRRDGGATWLIAGPTEVTLGADTVTLSGGRAFVDTEQGTPVTVVTSQGEVELSDARASVDVGAQSVTAYVLRGSARVLNGPRASAGEMLTLKGKETSKRAVVSWEDWTGGLGTADPTAAPAPFGIGTVGARPPGDQGKPRSSLVIERLQVTVTIDQDLAFTEVDQTFVNPTSETVEGIYRFRTPADATLGQFAVDRDGKLVWGRVKESKSAQQTYESHVYQGSTEDPALLAWESPGVYTARLYPIHAGEERRVVTRYSQWLPRQGKRGERRMYVYPMAAEGAKSSLPRIEEMTVKIDVGAAGATSIRSGMGGVREGDHITVKAFDFIPQADLAVELFDEGHEGLVGFRAPHALADTDIPEGMDADFAAEVEKTEADYVAIPLRVPPQTGKAPGVDLAIVVDTSAATETSELSIARSLAAALLAHLGPSDRASLFAGDATLRPVAPGSDQFTAITPKVRKQWLAGLASVERGGATDLGALLTQAATSLDPKRTSAVIYIGDGAPSVGEIAPQDLRSRLARLPTGTRIVPVAVGLQANVTLLEQVARGASLQVVEDAYGAARAALVILESASRITWTGATVDLGPGIERVLPKSLPPLAADETIMIVGRRTGKLPTELVLKGSGGESRAAISFNRLEDRGDLRRRWGTMRLAGLLEEGAGRSTLVDLSERYSLVSPFTSLYVPTRAEEEAEDYVDEAAPYEDRLAKLLRWKPWARDAGVLSAPAGLAEEEAVDKERLVLMEQYLDAQSESEAESDDREGGTGTRAQSEEAPMGSASASVNKRYAVKGPRDDADPHLARQQALNDAKDFGMIGSLSAGAAGEPPPPPGSPRRAEPEEARAEAKPAPVPSSNLAYDRAKSRPPSAAPPSCAPGDPLCVDRSSARGNMWGDGSVDAFGSGGLGLDGIGKGGGAVGEGQGFGSGAGRLGASHGSTTPKIRAGAASVNGRLPVEVIQRIVRQSFGRFRLCYEQGLSRNPQLEGRVAVRFTIANEGNVSLVNNGGSDLPDREVLSCLISAFYGLSFPQPEAGTVNVTYPLMLAPGDSAVAVAAPLAAPTKPVGQIGHVAIPCGPGADLPLSERRVLWRERLAAQTVVQSLSVYRSALGSCEATNWRERVALLVMMVDQLPGIVDRVSLWRSLLAISPGAADAVYRFIVLRVQSAEQLRQLHEALGFEQVDPDVLKKLLSQGKDARERLTLLRGVAEKFPDDSELALRVLNAYEDAQDEAGGRAWARQLRRRVDATSHLRTSVGEYYLRLAAKNAKTGARDESEGRRTFGEIVEFAPEDPLARRHLGDLLSAHGWHDEALRQYETLARLTPDDPTVKLLLARAAQGTGKTERAVKLAEQAAATSSPGGSQPVTVAARALSSVFLADARVEAKKAKKKDELARLRGRAGRLAADKEGAGARVVLTWTHPELRPSLWSDALGSMMPSADNFPLLRVAEAFVSASPQAHLEVRLDEEDAAHAARLGVEGRVVIIAREGQDDESIQQILVQFRDAEGKPRDRVSLVFDGAVLKEVQP